MKTKIVTILATVSLLLKSFTGVEISEDDQNAIADILVEVGLAIIVLIGIIKTTIEKIKAKKSENIK